MTYVEPRLSPQAVRWLNRQLEPLHLRVCRSCQGHALPLDAAHFYQRADGHYAHECIPCFRARSAAAGRARYASDPDYRARKRGSGRVVKPEYRERKRASGRDYKRRKRAAAFARVLERVTP